MIPEVIARWRPQANAFKGELETDLILAVVWQESSGNQWAYRYEPHYQYFYDANSKKALFNRSLNVIDNRAYALKVLGASEFHQQSASWGTMQTMGAVARELGYIGSITKLCDKDEGIKLGCKFLNNIYRDCGRDLRKTLKRYNGGDDYPDKIFAKLASIKE